MLFANNFTMTSVTCCFDESKQSSPHTRGACLKQLTTYDLCSGYLCWESLPIGKILDDGID